MVLHFLIRGRVQGVGFRWFVHREAAELGLRGWVRNTDAGEVEVVAAGPPEDLAELRTHCTKAPAAAASTPSSSTNSPKPKPRARPIQDRRSLVSTSTCTIQPQT